MATAAVVVSDDGTSNQLRTRHHAAATPTPSSPSRLPTAPSTDGDAAAVVSPQTQNPTTMLVLDVHEDKARADIISLFGYFDAQTTQLQGGYDNLGASIYTTLNLFVVFQVALIGAISYCAQKMKWSIGCESWWNLLILSVTALSALASTGTIVVVLHKFLEQFQLSKLGWQLRQERNDLLDCCLQNERLTMTHRLLLSNYRGISVFRAADHTEFCWWL